MDRLGLLLAVVVNPEDQQDHSVAYLVLCSLWEQFKQLKVICADTAYGLKGLPKFVSSTLGYSIELVYKAQDESDFEVIPKCWIANRTVPQA